MSKGFTFSLEGSETLQKRIQGLSDALKKDLAKEIEDSAYGIREKALKRVPSNKEIGQGNQLKQGIGARQIGNLSWEITSNAKYSAYVEFGTGQFAANYVGILPPEIQEYARKFYVNGKGHLPARPFLFNSYLEEQTRLIKAIKDILKDGGRK